MRAGQPPRLEEICRVLAAELPSLQRQFHVKSLGVFGSIVRGEATEESDVDILVEFEVPPTLFQFIELEDRLSEQLGMKVDLVMKSALKPHIAPVILQETITV